MIQSQCFEGLKKLSACRRLVIVSNGSLPTNSAGRILGCYPWSGEVVASTLRTSGSSWEMRLWKVIDRPRVRSRSASRGFDRVPTTGVASSGRAQGKNTRRWTEPTSRPERMANVRTH